MEEDATQSKQLTLIDLTAFALIIGVIAVLIFRNWDLQSTISQQKQAYESKISQLEKDYERQLALKEAEIRGLERGAALSR